MAASVKLGADPVEPSPPHELFPLSGVAPRVSAFDNAPDGRFLVRVPVGGIAAAECDRWALIASMPSSERGGMGEVYRGTDTRLVPLPAAEAGPPRGRGRPPHKLR